LRRLYSYGDSTGLPAFDRLVHRISLLIPIISFGKPNPYKNKGIVHFSATIY
jgi:hypothetical protein